MENKKDMEDCINNILDCILKDGEKIDVYRLYKLKGVFNFLRSKLKDIESDGYIGIILDIKDLSISFDNVHSIMTTDSYNNIIKKKTIGD